MASDRDKTVRADRLEKALDDLRARRSEPGAVRITQVENTGPPRVVISRDIRFPNSSSALRQHVADRSQVETPAPLVRIHVPPPGEVTDVVASARPPQHTRKASLFREPVAEPEAALPGSQLPETPHPETVVRTPLRSGAPRVVESAADLGEIVHQARRRRGLTQGELAAAAGTGRRFISELEAGKPTVEFERLLKVCNALGVDLFAATRSDG